MARTAQVIDARHGWPGRDSGPIQPLGQLRREPAPSDAYPDPNTGADSAIAYDRANGHTSAHVDTIAHNDAISHPMAGERQPTHRGGSDR